jgi:cell division septation protein DedD
MAQYANLNSFGEVYSTEENGKYKIRVGIFENRAEAVNAMNAIRNSGYRDAFLVKEEGALLGNNNAPTSPTQPEYPTNEIARGGAYKVQLAAYRNPAYFDPTPIAGLGTIEERMKGNLTVKFIGGIASLQQARQALAQARAAGFNTAFIVIEENGELRKVN